MLKIEVIKFEAQDVITTSIAAPTEAPKCTCDSEEYHRYYNQETKEHYWDHGNCPMTGKIDNNEHNCRNFVA